MEQGGIHLQDIDIAAYGWNAGFDEDLHLTLYVDRIIYESKYNPKGLSIFRQRIIDEIANDKAKHREFEDFVRSNEIAEKVVFLDHHLTHAIGAYACSPFDDALIVTCDGRGDFQSLTVISIKDGKQTVLQRETSIDSLGYFYGRVTHLLGFKPNRHEGKITGLAAYGDPEPFLPVVKAMIDLDQGRLRAKCGPLYRPSYSGYDAELEHLLDKGRPEDFAAAAQQHIENLVCEIIAQHLAASGCSNICLAGGVFGNVKLNQRVREIRNVRNVYVLPCMGDGGLALAAAVTAAYRNQNTRFPAHSMALGPRALDGGTTLNQLRTLYPDLKIDEPIDLCEKLCIALDNNEVIGMVKGAMEFGPRALCNRSIIYHARDRSANDWLNKRMHRTELMPFAPVTAEEFASSCYKGWQADHIAAQFMTMTYDCDEDFSKQCPTVVHVDGTARPQIVTRVSDPFMHKFLHAWYAHSGQMSLINTSFNRHEEPIILSLASAIQALQEGIVDLISVEQKFIITR